jgi:hypothetical protein
MAGAIVPSAKAIYLCEEVDVEGGMTNLYALFNAIRPDAYPHAHESFVCFAQLLGGLGDVPFYIDITRAEDEILIHYTPVLTLHFPNRNTLLHTGDHNRRVHIREARGVSRRTVQR